MIQKASPNDRILRAPMPTQAAGFRVENVQTGRSLGRELTIFRCSTRGLPLCHKSNRVFPLVLMWHPFVPFFSVSPLNCLHYACSFPLTSMILHWFFECLFLCFPHQLLHWQACRRSPKLGIPHVFGFQGTRPTLRAQRVVFFFPSGGFIPVYPGSIFFAVF